VCYKKNTYACRKWRSKHPAEWRAYYTKYQKDNKVAIAARRSLSRKKDLTKRLKEEAAYRDAHRDRINFTMNRRRRKVRQQCLDYLGGNRCTVCGFEHVATCVFDFHHKPGMKKKMGISASIARGYTFRMLKAELDCCEVLCRNCHSLLHWNGGVPSTSR
jgi:hypothetical protein